MDLACLQLKLAIYLFPAGLSSCKHLPLSPAFVISINSSSPYTGSEQKIWNHLASLCWTQLMSRGFQIRRPMYSTHQLFSTAWPSGADPLRSMWLGVGDKHVSPALILPFPISPAHFCSHGDLVPAQPPTEWGPQSLLWYSTRCSPHLSRCPVCSSTTRKMSPYLAVLLVPNAQLLEIPYGAQKSQDGDTNREKED